MLDIFLNKNFQVCGSSGRRGILNLRVEGCEDQSCQEMRDMEPNRRGDSGAFEPFAKRAHVCSVAAVDDCFFFT